ncbi:TonB-dependent receptor [Alloacidobacterium sp.]|uniref:TonB-dependent receptor n=1 Tax=Alloacidobacterium sp. TaxID=2951999 RepID=UPI002D261177|nr:TonB-dependent receptor [Alloacidobacterium sp.]HYK34980.1 TonB-dependent receptor [Alloacidobacterium sp.]
MIAHVSLHRFARLSLLLFLVSSLSVYAQYNSNIQGIVSDPTGAVINGASIQLRNVDTGVVAATTTSDAGNYRFSSLQPGHYIVTAEASGFNKTEVSLTLGTSETQGINVRLAVGSSSQMVTVTSQAPTLDPDETRLQTTLPAATVRDLPQLNRNLWDVLAVTPGVVGAGVRAAGTAPGGGNDNFGTQTPQLSANGRSYTGNLVMVDGMNVTSPVQNGNIILAPVPDAVQEASLQTNSWDAENSLGSSILIQVTTKSGTNQFHGTGSLLFTNQDLQATPDFQTTVASFSRKDLVGTLGGPVIKNRVFFFADFEKLWSSTPEQQGTQTFEAPEFVSWAQQNFTNSVGTQALTQYPAIYLKSTGVATTASNYLLGSNGCAPGQTSIPVNGSTTIPCSLPVLDSGSFVFSPYYNALQYNFRGDFYATDNDRIYLSYYNDSFDQQQASPRKGLGALDIMRNRYGQADYTHTFSPHLLAEGSFAFASVGGANGQDANLKVPEITVSQGSEGFHIGGGWGPGEYRGPNYNWRAILNWAHGKHSFKFGYTGDHAIEHGDFTPVNVRPGFVFADLVQLVQDNPVNETVGAYDPLTGMAGKVVFGGQTNPFGFYAQDDWKVRSNVLLTLSLRWDNFTNHTAWGNSGFQFSSLLLGSGSTFPEQVANAIVRPVSGVFANSMSNFWSPRIGVAWDPSNSGLWSIRGGVGVFRDWVVLGQSVDEMRNNPPGVISPTFTTGCPNPPDCPVQPIFALAPSGTYPFNYPLPPIPANSLNPAGGITGIQSAVDSLARNLTAPLAVNFVIGVERQLPWNLVAGANYSGSQSYNGLSGADVNRYAGGAVIGGGGETINRLNPNFGTITYVNNPNAASYHAMILSVRGRYGQRANFQASYTLSHAQSYPEANTRFDQDAGLNIPDQNAYFSYWGDANWDVRQRFSLSGLYVIPGLQSGIGRVLTSGWELSSIMALQSGTPFWVYNTNPPTAAVNPGDYNLDGLNWDIPNAPAKDFTGSHGRSSYKNGIFTATDFPAPATGQEGSLKRNIYRNPGLTQIDASLLKNTHLPWLGEQSNLQFRFDFLNLFNHPNLGPVNADMANSNLFGTVSTALAARQIQLGIRVSF